MNIKNSMFNSFSGFELGNSDRIMGGETGTKDDGKSATSNQGSCDTQTNDTANEEIVATSCETAADAGSVGPNDGGNDIVDISSPIIPSYVSL